MASQAEKERKMPPGKIPEEQLTELRACVTLVRAQHSILHQSDMSFFKEIIESFGGVIPPDEDKSDKTCPAQEKPKAATPTPADEEPELVESDYELGQTGVLEPDNEAPKAMGSVADQKWMKEYEEKLCSIKQEAITAFADGDYEKAAGLFTEAIKMNSSSDQVWMYTKRANCFVHLKKPNDCIKDCDQALEINPNSAAALKYRGHALGLNGMWHEAAQNLRSACKLDCDDQANEWLKVVKLHVKEVFGIPTPLTPPQSSASERSSKQLSVHTFGRILLEMPEDLLLQCAVSIQQYIVIGSSTGLYLHNENDPKNLKKMRTGKAISDVKKIISLSSTADAEFTAVILTGNEQLFAVNVSFTTGAKICQRLLRDCIDVEGIEEWVCGAIHGKVYLFQRIGNRFLKLKTLLTSEPCRAILFSQYYLVLFTFQCYSIFLDVFKASYDEMFEIELTDNIDAAPFKHILAFEKIIHSEKLLVLHMFELERVDNDSIFLLCTERKGVFVNLTTNRRVRADLIWPKPAVKNFGLLGDCVLLLWSEEIGVVQFTNSSPVLLLSCRSPKLLCTTSDSFLLYDGELNRIVSLPLSEVNKSSSTLL